MSFPAPPPPRPDEHLIGLIEKSRREPESPIPPGKELGRPGHGMMRLLCLWAHRPHVPAGVHAYDPISCTRCGRVFDADAGSWAGDR